MNKKNIQKRQVELWKLIPIGLSIGFVPLIVHLFSYNTGLSVYDWFPNGSEMNNDFFMAWKSIAMIGIGIIMLVIMGYQKVKRESFRFENPYYLILFYLLFVVMSALFSPYKKWVARGSYELMEPVWVLFAYVILCFYAYNIAKTEEDVKRIGIISGIGIAIDLIIGTFQTFGLNFLQSALGKMLMVNIANWSNRDKIEFNIPATYMTLYNPDYVVFYIGLILPILITLIIVLNKTWKKIVATVASIAAIICLIGSNTTTGWMSILLAVVVTALILLSRNRKVFRISAIVLSIAIIMGCVFVGTSNRATGFRNIFIGTFKESTDFAIKNIETTDDVLFDYNGVKTHFTYESNTDEGTIVIHCKDDEGNEIYQSQNDTTSSIYENNAKYTVEPIYLGDILGLRITVDNLQWHFAKLDDGTYYYYNAAGKFVKFPKTQYVQLLNDDALSFRGHIWNKTIPKLVKHIFVGSGANTYMMEIPQDEYIYKAYLNMDNIFDVKAHNWFLQQWIENGMFAMILLIAFYLWYFIASVKIYRRVDFKQSIHKVGFAVFVGLLIYMIAATVNDPTVNVAPMYWALLGLGFSINRMIVEHDSLVMKKESFASTEGKNMENIIETSKDKQLEKPANFVKRNKKTSRRERKQGRKG